MKSRIWTGAAALCFVLASCGGGSGGNGGNSPSAPSQPTPAPTPLSTLSTTARLTFHEVEQGQTEGSYPVLIEVGGSSSEPIVPVVSFPDGDIKLDSEIKQIFASDGLFDGYSFTVSAPAGLDVKQHRIPFEFRLCTTADCDRVYPGSTLTGDFILWVQLADWANFQRDAGHRGSVAIEYDHRDIEFLWEWNQPNPAVSSTRTVVPITTSNHETVFTVGFTLGNDGAVYSIGNDGGLAGFANLGNSSYISAPSIVDLDSTFLGVINQDFSSENVPLFLLNSGLLDIADSTSFPSQSTDHYGPTVYGETLYMAAGYYGNEVYAFDANDGALLWKSEGSKGQVWTAQAPAVDEDFVYYYSGALDILRRADGALVRSIEDPDFTDGGFEYYGSPVLDGEGRAFVLSGTGRPKSDRPLVAFDLDRSNVAWTSTARYRVQPASHDGKLYAGRGGGRVDALDATNGNVLWTWQAPDGEELFGNIAVTDNLLFVGTTTKVYAVDISGSAPRMVFEDDFAGFVSISPAHRLLVRGPDGLRAYKLRDAL